MPNHVLMEYGRSGEDVSVNAVIIPQNWRAIPLTDTASPELLHSLNDPHLIKTIVTDESIKLTTKNSNQIF